jgi:phosphoribosylformylglycinamidine cyclo-ligase
MSEDADGDGTDTDAADEGLTYAETGVDVAASEAATAALIARAGGTGGEFAGIVDLGDRHLGLTTDGVGTKLLVAAALDDYSTVGIDCVAMNANDLVAAGLEPVAFVDYLAVDAPDEATAAAVGEGLDVGAERAGVDLVGGETAVMPEVVTGLDLAGACVGLASPEARFPGEAAVGDALVGVPSSGIHSNGLTLAREAVTREAGYDDPFPADDSGRSVGEALLEPTRIYVDLLGPMREHGVRGAVHVTGGGFGNLDRLGERRYVIDEPHDPQPVFEFVARAGGVSRAEMYRTFNMGTGFLAAVAPERADALAAATGGRVVGRVEAGSGVVVEGAAL